MIYSSTIAMAIDMAPVPLPPSATTRATKCQPLRLPGRIDFEIHTMPPSQVHPQVSVRLEAAAVDQG
jgi:hypothetical protein